MAPRKNVDKIRSQTSKKVAKNQIKQKIKVEKPKLKVPSVIKIKIPPLVNKPIKVEDLNADCVSVRRDVIRKPTKKQKLQLANEVALAQLKSPKDTVPVVASEVFQYNEKEVEKKVPKKRGVKEVAEPVTSCMTSITDSEEVFDLTPKKQKYVRKVPAKTAQPKKNVPQPKKASNKTKASQKKLPTTSSSKKLKTQSNEPDATTLASNKNTKAKAQKRTPTKTRKNPPRTRKRRYEENQGKTNQSDTSSDIQISPSDVEKIEFTLKKELDSPLKDDVLPCRIDSRKTSITGTSDCPSWTKDISSSSTTTCVTVSSRDFVRIDKKIPILKLTDIDKLNHIVVREKVLTSDSDSSSTFEPKTPLRVCSPVVDNQSLQLSTSSITLSKFADLKENNNDLVVPSNEPNELTSTVDKLSAKLKNFDMEIINWIGYDSADVDTDVRKFQERIFRVLKDESEVITHCHRLKQVLSEDNNKNTVGDSNTHQDNFTNDTKINKDKEEFAIPATVTHIHKSNVTRHHSPPKDVDRLDFEPDFNYKSFDHSNDDDDALSLFAESITAIETSRMNNSTTSNSNIARDNFEEYVPQPLSEESPNKVIYVPSKIVDKRNYELKKIVCEKQNADSTSLSNKETEVSDPVTNVPINTELVSYPSLRNVFNTSHVNFSLEFGRKKIPYLMSSLYTPIAGIKSLLFKGICFFNLLCNCKKLPCKFPHIILDTSEVKLILMRMNEVSFIQEYMLIRNWPMLRRRYFMCFVEECQKRELTRILVEMAIDAHMKANENCRDDEILKVEVFEIVLMYLNEIDLECCEDLLLYALRKDYYLCNLFLKSIADTQNFSRFKHVFVKLTLFMVQHNCVFCFDVATLILERVSILPFELPLSEALLEIVKYTDPSIFNNSMMGHFEKQLCSSSQHLFEQFLSIKKASLSRLHRPLNMIELPSQHSQNGDVYINTALVHNEREKRYTSPDTTNKDNMNKTDLPKITRTVDFTKRHCPVNRLTNCNSSGSNGNNEEKYFSKPPPKFSDWNGRSVFNKISGAMRSSSYMMPVNSRQAYKSPTNGPSPSKFPRRN